MVCNPKTDSNSEFGGRRTVEERERSAKGAKERRFGKGPTTLLVEARGHHGKDTSLPPWWPRASMGS
jgi:hypothetical protein